MEYASDGYVYVGEFYQFASVPHDWRLNEIRISKYETDGTLVSYAIVDMPFGVFGPDKDFYISPDAKVYHMRYDLDALYIYEIEMGNTAISTALYLYNQYMEQ